MTSTSSISEPTAAVGEPVRPRWKTWLIWTAVTAFFLGPSMFGFVTKFVEFVVLFRGSADGVFAVTPITNYLLASLGFFCLLCWAAASGKFQDLESPKRWMLENEVQLDRNDPTAGCAMPERKPRRRVVAAR